jgi:peptidyl-prolyl cis-trans isomerase A (cyclophilin A)
MKLFCSLLLMIPCVFAQGGKMADGLYAVFATSEGNFTAKLYEKETPRSVENFVALAEGTKAWKDPKTHAMVKRPLYDNLEFYRVMPSEMIQSGSATGTTGFDCGVSVRDEFLPGLMFDRAGKLAVANSGGPDSGGCQFFITAGPMRSWDGKYAVFGLVVKGLEVVQKIATAPVHDEKPLAPVKLLSVTIMRIGAEPEVKKKK